jgi:predicted alpha/beta hydrolase
MQSRDLGPYLADQPIFFSASQTDSIFNTVKTHIKKVANYLLGNKIAKLIVTSSQRHVVIKNESLLSSLANTIAYKTQVITYDTAILKGHEYHYHNEKDHSGVYLLYMPGANNLYQETHRDFLKMAQHYKATITTFNYRGTGESHGFKLMSASNLIVDTISQIDRLIQYNVPANKIIIYAPSLGGSIASFVTDYFHQKNQKINLYQISAPSSISEVISNRIKTLGHTGHYEYWFMIPIAVIVKPILKGILHLVDWNLDGVNAFNNIPAQNKQQVVVRSPKRERNLHKRNLKDDTVIPYKASMYYALKRLGVECDENAKFKAVDMRADGHEYGIKLERVNDQTSQQDCFSHFFNRVKNKEASVVEDSCQRFNFNND